MEGITGFEVDRDYMVAVLALCEVGWRGDVTIENLTDFFDCEELAWRTCHASKPAAEENREDHILHISCPESIIPMSISYLSLEPLI